MTELAPEHSSKYTPPMDSSPEQSIPIYPIRAHHLETLTPLVMLRWPYTTDELATAITEDSVSGRGNLTTQSVDFDILSSPKSRNADTFWATYSYDLVGETDEQVERFRIRLQEALNSFLGLEDDDLVKLSVDVKDRICDACTFKIHCKAFPKDNDRLMLGVFEDVVQHYSPTDVKLTKAERSQDGRSMITNAGTVRRAMGYFALAGRGWFSDLYRDAITRRETYGDVFSGPDKPKVETYYEQYGHELD